MDYKIINNIVEVPKSDKGTILSITILKENIDNVSVLCDYNTKGDSTKVTIKVRKKGIIIESRTFPNFNIFPKHIERNKTNIIIYLESFGYEN